MSDEAPTQAEVESAKEERDRKEKTRDIKVAVFRECLAGYQAAQEICQTLQMNIKDAPEDGFKTNWKKIMTNLGQDVLQKQKEQLKQLKKYKIEVIKSIHDTVNILEKNYGIRDVEQDLGGYVVIAENIVDIEIMKQDKLQV